MTLLVGCVEQSTDGAQTDDPAIVQGDEHPPRVIDGRAAFDRGSRQLIVPEIVDLRDIAKPNLRGRQSIELRLTFLNTGARFTLDEVRLVDALSPEAQPGFVPAGLNLRLERREPRPYHGLGALNARARAPIRFDLPEEKAVFRDTSTRASVDPIVASAILASLGVFVEGSC